MLQSRKKMKPSDSIGPYRFKYPDHGLAIYRISDVVEQYLACDEYFWWQALRVGKKVYKFQVFLHTKEEERMKIWKTFRVLERVDSKCHYLHFYTWSDKLTSAYRTT